MRPLRSVADVGGESLTGKSSLAPVKNLWNEWEIHFLILASLALQFLLFFTAGMRRRSTSRVLSIVLWLAYLSADSVAIFVLGHLAVRGASGPEHELILFWAPFLLVHLGGQDTITALSVQDNELWTRHLLGFVSQVAVAGYVVSKSSWPDRRMLAATVLVFLTGSLKYAGRTYCLYFSRPANVRVASLRILSYRLNEMDIAAAHGYELNEGHGLFRARFAVMIGTMNSQATCLIMFLNQNYRHLLSMLENNDVMEIMSADAPVNELESLLVAGDLPSIHEEFQLISCLQGAYEYVGGKLEKCYESFYTKRPLLDICKKGFDEVLILIFGICCLSIETDSVDWMKLLWLIATMFQYISIPIALVFFILADKGHQVHSRADIIVTYLLLVGAITLDLSSASMSIVSSVRSSYFRGNRWCMINAILSVANYIQPSWCRKQWSEMLAQYNMVKRYTVQDTRGLSSVQHRIIKRLTAWGIELLDPSLTHTPVTKDLMGFVLHSLVQFGTNQQYDIANFRGRLALQKWRPNGSGTMALYYSIDSMKDFPRSVLIWHIATDICYYSKHNNMTNTYSDKSKKKEMSREMSNYILYLVFKCGVLRTSNSQLVHNKVHYEMKRILVDQQPPTQMINLGEREVVMKVFKSTIDKEQPSAVDEKKEHTININNAIVELLKSTSEAIYSPVLPHASKVAQELMGIKDDAERWDLIAAVWLEMLYYIAPRCGGAFHYQHLSTGDEFITHVLLLMRSLGPFLPGPDSSAS